MREKLTTKNIMTFSFISILLIALFGGIVATSKTPVQQTVVTDTLKGKWDTIVLHYRTEVDGTKTIIKLEEQ